MYTLEELIEMGVTEDVAKKLVEGFKEKEGNKVPISRLNEVIKERDGYKTQINNLESEISGLKEVSGNNEALNKKIAELEESNNKAKDDFNKAIRETKIENAINLALIEAEAKNPATVKPLINRKDILLTEDGSTVVGLKEQIAKLKENEDTSFLFGKKTKNISGVEPKEGTNKANPPKKESEMTYSDWVALLAEKNE